MKSCLNKKKSIVNLISNIFVLFLVFLVISCVKVKAQTKVEYYKGLFGRDFRLPIYSDESNSGKDFFLTNDPTSGYLLLLSSSLSVTNNASLEGIITENRKIILICDKPINVSKPFKLLCDKSFVKSSDFVVLGGIARRYDPQGLDAFVVPEDILTSPDSRSTAEKYFKAYRRSDMFPVMDEESESISRILRKVDQVKVLVETPTFEVFSITLLIFVVLSLFYKFINSFGVKERKGINIKGIESVLKKLKLYFVSCRHFVIYEILVLTVMYIPLVVILGVKDIGSINIGYFVKYSLDSLRITNLVSYINQGNYFRIIIFFYNFAYITSILSLLAPRLIEVLIAALSGVYRVKFNKNTQRYLVPGVLTVLLAVVSFTALPNSYRFVAFLLVLLAFLTLNNLKFNTFSYKYSSNEKILFLAVAFLTVITGFASKYREIKVGPEYKYEDLIGVNDEVVTLPYSKQLGENVIFNDFYISLPEPVFIDRYMVYSPVNGKIENRNAKDFVNTGSFFIQNGNPVDMVSAISSSSALSKILVSDVPTNFFKLSGLSSGQGQKEFTIKITFTCNRIDIGQNEIRANFYYLNGNSEVEESESRLIYFPGCSRPGEPEAFTSKFKLPNTQATLFFIRLIDVQADDIKDIKILDSNVVITPTFYLKGKGYKVIISEGMTDSSKPAVTNYIFGDTYNLSFDVNTDLDGKFNISKPINVLVKKGIIKDSTLLWSTKSYVPIRVN